MAAIPKRFGSGGANLAPGGNAGKPSLADALRDIADDLAALKPATPVAGWCPAECVVRDLAVDGKDGEAPR